YRAQVRRNGVYRSRTFKTLREAQEWQRITDGKAAGRELIDNALARKTSLEAACDWMLAGNRAGSNPTVKISKPSCETGRKPNFRAGRSVQSATGISSNGAGRCSTKTMPMTEMSSDQTRSVAFKQSFTG